MLLFIKHIHQSMAIESCVSCEHFHPQYMVIDTHIYYKLACRQLFNGSIIGRSICSSRMNICGPSDRTTNTRSSPNCNLITTMPYTKCVYHIAPRSADMASLIPKISNAYANVSEMNIICVVHVTFVVMYYWHEGTSLRANNCNGILYFVSVNNQDICDCFQ